VTEMSTAPVAPAPRRQRPDRPGRPVARAAEPARHRRDIEGLRAVAVLLVVAYHCGLPFIGGGYVGVDVFFVISGFLITGLLLREAERTGTVSIPRFYARRALRLLPASSVVVMATVAASAWWLPPLRLGAILSDALHTTVYAMNWRLAAIGTDYLNADADPSPLQHFWSLAVEEQFYLIWPLLMLVVLRRGGRGLTTVLAVLTAGSLLVSVWQTRHSAGWAYFGAHTRAWELGMGALLAVGAARLRHLRPAVATTLVGAGLVAIAASALGYTEQTPFPGSAALLPVLGAAAVIAGGTARPAGLLGLPVLQIIGRYSYSWYLWHWPMLLIAPYAVNRPLTAGENVLVALAALMLAALTYALVENPVRHLTALRDRPWRGIGVGVLLSALCAGLCALLTFTAVQAHGVSKYVAPKLTGTARLQQSLAAAETMPAVPRNLTPKLTNAAKDKPRLYADQCSPAFADASVKTEGCTYGDRKSRTTVVLFGDSHAGHWFPALEKVALQKHWRLVVVTKSACSAGDVLLYEKTLKRLFTECEQWRHSAWAYIRAQKPAKVILASTVPSPPIPGVEGSQDDAWAAAWKRSVDAVSGPGTKTYFINDTPWQAGNVPDCLSAHLDDPQHCTRSRSDAVQRTDRRRIVADAAHAEGATVIDPLPWFCTATSCPVIVDDVLVYKDQHHITTTYSRLLAPLLSAQIQ
jgi:peptidoglycan/LPS O-acetylase OafA/YrhL